MISSETRQAIGEEGSVSAGLRLLLLFGSRARADERPESDWDLGYLASADFDVDDLLARLVTVLGSDRIDLVDLGRAGAQLRYRAAADGVPLFSTDPTVYPRFWLDAVSFWCDMQRVLSAGYEQVLSRLPK